MSVVFGVVSGWVDEVHPEEAEDAHDDGYDGDAEACSHLPGGGEGNVGYDHAA